jgi:hypothetical protein
MTAHDWLQVMTKAGDYVLHEIFEVHISTYLTLLHINVCLPHMCVHLCVPITYMCVLYCIHNTKLAGLGED